MSLKVIEELKEKLRGKDKTIVLPEGTDPRILEATERLHKEGVIIPILLGNPEEVKNAAKEHGFDIDGVTIRNPEDDSQFDRYVDAFVERRKGKNTKEEGQSMLKNPNYFATMMVQVGDADGMVSGAVHTTGDTVRPVLQIIKTKPGVSRTSGAMILLREDEKYLFADVAINTFLDAQQLAEVSLSSAITAQTFGIDPKIALLSYSSKGSAVTEDTKKVAEATKIARQLAKEKGYNFDIDGEMQFDAAFAPEVAKLKVPDSVVAGRANTFIFPNLEAGNIGYKIAQRLGGFTAVGPILQGLNKPVNDLSRGCNVEDVYMTSIVTAAQSL
ncbi:phosphate acetyltransferase [uncultured Helcococcus sp.]|uniref:phosphate acetyltransferase n=1 Tax=uncultured Helcococcus sp. TaxID=1072508 RepID=UPI00288C21CC|nr:phosphate acetyltransferase [uncultured Helcococcus sp.]